MLTLYRFVTLISLLSNCALTLAVQTTGAVHGSVRETDGQGSGALGDGSDS